MAGETPSDSGSRNSLEAVLPTCIFLDLEADNDRIFQIGAVRGDAVFERKGNFDLREALEALDQFAAGSAYVVGHNLLGHDWPILRGLAPHLALLKMPVIDTLYLSPLAFPENPYHALIKDYKLVRSAMNDPVADARLSLRVFQDEWSSLQALASGGAGDRLSLYRHCFDRGLRSGAAPDPCVGMTRIFEHFGARTLDQAGAQDILDCATQGQVCQSAVRGLLERLVEPAEWAGLAYAAAWLPVAGGNSVLPPWVRYRFPAIVRMLRELREIPCGDSTCAYCTTVHDPKTQLMRYFGFSVFRARPAAPDGTSLQENIVRKGLGDLPLLAILPTAGGKSLCYQLPGLVRNFRRGVLTIVVSPLQALMKDQVDNFTAKTGSPSAAALSGLLTPPERGEVLERVRLGDIALLYVSPEQLRNRSFTETIKHREIGCWVLDEAHCLSKWGHDFRPDYLYVSRFIREFAEKQHTPIPPVACFTATAKRDVIDEIVKHFQESLGQTLEVFRGNIDRENLRFEVQPITQPEKFPRVHALLQERLGPTGNAVVYTATRKTAELAAEFLTRQGWSAKAFHAGLSVALKREIQDGFVRGSIRVICATNAFGMGIDKEDVRVVVHVDMPGSLENYLQEAGRAGRDAEVADCVLLYGEEDIETQFGLAALSQLNPRDFTQILRGLRRARREGDLLVITSAELLRDEEVDATFDADDPAADTKVKTAVAWLERSGFLERNENRTNVFQGKPLLTTLEEAEQKLARLELPESKRRQWLAILGTLMNVEGPEGLSADELAQLPALRDPGPSAAMDRPVEESPSQRVIRILHEMAEAGLVRQGLLLSAYVRYKIADSSQHRLQRASAVETAMLKLMQEQSPDAEDQAWQSMSLRRINQALVDEGFESSPELLRSLLISLSRDGKGFAQSHPTLEFRHDYSDHYRIKLRRSWPAAVETSQRRRDLAAGILEAILSKIPAGTSAGADLLVEFSSDELATALRQDMVLAGQIRDMLAAIDRGLMYLHEQKAIILQHGLAVFRQAMTIRLLPQAKGRRYTRGDFDPLARHYEERVLQVHVMSEYARRGLESIRRGLDLVDSYFHDPRSEFMDRYFTGRDHEITRAVSPELYQAIVDDLRNPVQIAVVAAPEDDNQLILAGPGSGKTRVVVHRVAYLVRVKRVRARGILVLCFNRRAAMELRTRLRNLLGADGAHVTVLTYHGLAMRLTGTSFAEWCMRPGDEPFDFDSLIPAATHLLRGEGRMPGVEEDELRDRLLAGYRHILVDEYQDIDAAQYELISALADRTGKDPDGKLTILAVGDDDQNIYAFRGTNVAFIRRFEQDYHARCHYLVENYRSTGHIIAAANALIAHNRDRMKTERAIQLNRQRRFDPAGGEWESLDPVARGKVQVLEVPPGQAEAAVLVSEMRRLHDLQPGTDWSAFAVLARTRRALHTVRGVCEHFGIPVRWILDRDQVPGLHRIREIACFLDVLRERRHDWLTATELLRLQADVPAAPDNPWSRELTRLLECWRDETSDAPLPCADGLEYLYETLAEQRRDPCIGRGVLLSTVHAAKGTEFDHVLIPNVGWQKDNGRANEEEERRLYYVGMTRARKTLSLFDEPGPRNPHAGLLDGRHVFRRTMPVTDALPPAVIRREYEMLGPADVHLDFAARYPATDPLHAAIARLRPGDPLRPCLRDQSIQLLASDGQCVGQLSRAAADRWRERLETVELIRVVAMMRRERIESKAEYMDACRCDRWEVPLAEIICVPVAESGSTGR